MTWDSNPVVETRATLFNGQTWDPSYNNLTGTLLPAAARTTAPAIVTLPNPNHRYLRLYLNIIAASATGSLTLALLGIEPLTQTLTQTLLQAVAISGAAAAGLRVYEFGPGLVTGMTGLDGATQSQAGLLPRSWTAQVLHGDASAWTYALSFSLFV